MTSPQIRLFCTDIANSEKWLQICFDLFFLLFTKLNIVLNMNTVDEMYKFTGLVMIIVTASALYSQSFFASQCRY